MVYNPFATRVDGVDSNHAADVNVINVGLGTFTRGVYSIFENGGIGDGTSDDSGHLATTDSINGGNGISLVSRNSAGYAIATSHTILNPLRLEGKLLVASGQTLTINGPFDAPLVQVFGGAGTVVFGPGSVKETHAIWWGVKGDGSTDQTAALQAALNATPAGATCRLLDSGSGYRFSGTLTIPDHVTLACRDGGAPPQDVSDTGCQLQTTYATGGAGGTPFLTLGHNAKLRGVSVFHPNQTNTNPPVAYPYAIAFVAGAGKSGAALENVCLLNAYQGLQAVNHGRFKLHGLRLDCANTGILVDNCQDWPDVSDVEFWPFWTGSSSDAWATYKQANLTAITLERCDGWMSDRFKVFLANIAVLLSSSASGTSYGTWSNTQLDTVNCGIKQSNSSDIGHDFDGLQVLAAGNATATRAIWATGGSGGTTGSGGIRVHGGLLRGATNSSSLGVQNLVDIESGVGDSRFTFVGVNFGNKAGESSPPYNSDIRSASTTACIVTSACRFLSPYAYHIDVSAIANGSAPTIVLAGTAYTTLRQNNPNSITLITSEMHAGS